MSDGEELDQLDPDKIPDWLKGVGIDPKTGQSKAALASSDMSQKSASDTQTVATAKPAPSLTDVPASSVPRPPAIKPLPVDNAVAPALPPTTPDAKTTASVGKIISQTPIPAPPDQSTPGSTLSQIAAQRAAAGQPIDRSDPKYRMGTGMRVLGTVGNFLTGFGGKGGPLTYVGPGATNAKYGRDVATQQEKVGNLDTQFEQQKTIADQSRKMYEDAMRSQNEQALADIKGQLAEAATSKASTAQELADLKANAAPKVTAEDQKIGFQKINAKLSQEFGADKVLNAQPKDIATMVSNSKTLTPQEKSDFTGYARANKTPDTAPIINVNQAGAKNDARLDKSYQYESTKLTNVRKPLGETLDKLARTLTNIDLNSPQADSLLAPQILSIMAGGQGSGLRMNEAEISRILGGATVWENLKRAVNKWSLDPDHAAIPVEQRQQMMKIVSKAAERGQQKAKVLEDAEQQLIDADSIKEQRQIVVDTNKKLDDIDFGAIKNATAGGGGGYKGASDFPITDPQGGVHHFNDKIKADKFQKQVDDWKKTHPTGQ